MDRRKAYEYNYSNSKPEECEKGVYDSYSSRSNFYSVIDCSLCIRPTG